MDMRSGSGVPLSGKGRLADRYGPVALVTGASDGIGRAMAGELAAAGLSLLLVARRADRLQAVADDLHARFGVAASILPLDLSDPAALRRLLAETEGLDIGLLVAAAGFGTSGGFLESDITEEENMLAVNCAAVLPLVFHFGRRLAARGRGGIVLMSSLVAFQGVPHAAHYAATKAYIQSLAEGLSAELAARGVDIVASAPGPVQSSFAARARMTMGQAVSPVTVARQTLAALGQKTTVRPGFLSKFLAFALVPLPRWGRVRMMGQVMAGMTGQQHGKNKIGNTRSEGGLS